MSNIEDILAFAWNKDAANLKMAVDDVFQSKISDQMGNLYNDVSASVYGTTAGQEVVHDEEVENDFDDDEASTTEVVD